MSANVAIFTIAVAVPGDKRTLPEAKHSIEDILDRVREIPGVTLRHRRGTPMLICTNPELVVGENS
jgi:hypothetical protein